MYPSELVVDKVDKKSNFFQTDFDQGFILLNKLKHVKQIV